MSSYLEEVYSRRNGLRSVYRRQLRLMKIGKTTQSCAVCQHNYCRGNQSCYFRRSRGADSLQAPYSSHLRQVLVPSACSLSDLPVRPPFLLRAPGRKTFGCILTLCSILVVFDNNRNIRMSEFGGAESMEIQRVPEVYPFEGAAGAFGVSFRLDGQAL